MSLSTRLLALAQAIGADIKSISLTLAGLSPAATMEVQTNSNDLTSGRILLTNAFGSGTGNISTLSTPLDDIPRLNGFWSAGGIAVTVMGGYPAGIQFAGNADSSATQIGTDYLGVDMYFRRLHDSVWSTTKKVWHNENLLNIGTTSSTARTAIKSSIMPAYTLATLPSAAANINMIVVVTDLSSGREPCISDGASWLKLSDKAVAA